MAVCALSVFKSRNATCSSVASTFDADAAVRRPISSISGTHFEVSSKDADHPAPCSRSVLRASWRLACKKSHSGPANGGGIDAEPAMTKAAAAESSPRPQTKQVSQQAAENMRPSTVCNVHTHPKQTSYQKHTQVNVTVFNMQLRAAESALQNAPKLPVTLLME